MLLKTIVKDVLLLFVGASLGIGLMDTIRPDTHGGDPTPTIPMVTDVTKGKLIAYYFHGTHRCETCTTMEAFAHVALEQKINEGQVSWRVVNYDLSVNKALREEFKIVGPTLVLLDPSSGGRWKNLTGVWDHAEDKPAFVAYVRSELDAFMEAQP